MKGVNQSKALRHIADQMALRDAVRMRRLWQQHCLNRNQRLADRRRRVEELGDPPPRGPFSQEADAFLASLPQMVAQMATVARAPRSGAGPVLSRGRKGWR